jgi:hypothetical protein
MTKACLETESFPFDPAFQRQLQLWLVDERADKMRIVVSHQAAALLAQAVNAQSNTDDLPNQQDAVNELLAKVHDLKVFLRVFDDLRAIKEFQMFNVKVKIL